jgi:GT2 family glycosyltransferase
MISFIILTRDHPEYLKKCLEALLNQTFSNWNAIVIDTSTPDNLIENGFQCSLIGPKVMHWEYAIESGYAAKNNMGIKEALENKECKFICLLNDDAFPDSKFVETVIKYSDKYNDAMIFSPLYLYAHTPEKIQIMGGGIFTDDFLCGENVFFNNRLLQSLSKKELEELNIPRYLDYGYGTCICYKREIFEKIGLLDEYLKHGFDELDMCKRAALKNIKTLYIPVKVLHIAGGSSDKNIFKSFHTILPMARGHFYFLLKHYTLKIAITMEYKRITQVLLKPKSLLLELYSIIWNLFNLFETRIEYNELYKPET